MPPSQADHDSAGGPGRIIRLADLSRRRDTSFTLEPDAPARAAIAAELGIPAIRKLRLSGHLEAVGRADWRLVADLGATVVQDCVVTLAPVVTRIDEEVRRQFVEGFTDPGPGEVEMPEDDTLEPLPQTLDLGAVMIEALALALPPWPRAEGAELPPVTVSDPGTEPLTDAALRPFAGLKAALGLPEGDADDPEDTGREDTGEEGEGRA